MSKHSRKLAVAVGLLVVALVVGVAALIRVTSGPARRSITVDAGATTRRVDPYIASATLGIYDMERQAALEADMPAEARKAALAILDDARAKMRAVLDNPALSNGDRIVAVGKLNHEYSGRLDQASGGRAVVARSGEIWRELDLMLRRELLPLMFDKLDMTDAQHKAAEAAFMEVWVVVQSEPAGGMPNERSMQAMLAGRDKLHALLTPSQRVELERALPGRVSAVVSSRPSTRKIEHVAATTMRVAG